MASRLSFINSKKKPLSSSLQIFSLISTRPPLFALFTRRVFSICVPASTVSLFSVSSFSLFLSLYFFFFSLAVLFHLQTKKREMHSAKKRKVSPIRWREDARRSERAERGGNLFSPGSCAIRSLSKSRCSRGGATDPSQRAFRVFSSCFARNETRELNGSINYRVSCARHRNTLSRNFASALRNYRADQVPLFIGFSTTSSTANFRSLRSVTLTCVMQPAFAPPFSRFISSKR